MWVYCAERNNYAKGGISLAQYSQYPLHAGQYKHRKDAEGYADKLRMIGDQVEVKEITMYEVIVTGRNRK